MEKSRRKLRKSEFNRQAMPRGIYQEGATGLLAGVEWTTLCYLIDALPSLAITTLEAGRTKDGGDRVEQRPGLVGLV